MAATVTESGSADKAGGLDVDLVLDGITLSGEKLKDWAGIPELPGAIRFSCHISEDMYDGDGWPLLQERIPVLAQALARAADGDGWETFEDRETNYLSFYAFDGEDEATSVNSEQNADFLEEELAKESGLPKSPGVRAALEDFLDRVEKAEWRLRARMALRAVRQICSREEVLDLLDQVDIEKIMTD